MIDGEHIADHCCIVALAITADGTKVPVGLWEGSTENKTVAKHLLADLVARGLDAEDGLLVVIDGAKALSSAVKAVFGAKAAIQRCTVHKRRNVAEHLPESERDWVDLKLVRALNTPDAAAGLRLATTLTTSNPIESMISIARSTNRNVTRWRDGEMVLRWTAAGMINAERSFRRVKGYKQMPQLVAALRRHVHPTNASRQPETVGAAA